MEMNVEGDADWDGDEPSSDAGGSVSKTINARQISSVVGVGADVRVSGAVASVEVGFPPLPERKQHSRSA